MDKIPILTVTVPKKYMNLGVDLNGRILFGDTNDSNRWSEFKLELPEGNWKYGYRRGEEVTLLPK